MALQNYDAGAKLLPKYRSSGLYRRSSPDISHQPAIADHYLQSTIRQSALENILKHSFGCSNLQRRYFHRKTRTENMARHCSIWDFLRPWFLSLPLHSGKINFGMMLKPMGSLRVGNALTPTPTPTPTPTLNSKLSVIYAQAEQKIAAAAKRKKDSSKDKGLLDRFKGEYPPTLLSIMSGKGTDEDVGFHQIAMQIAITTNALGKSEALMLEACKGLIANHVSDGTRYSTPRARAAELSRMYHYTADNVCYTYSKDALRAVVPEGADTKELDGIFVQGEVSARW